MKCFTRVKSSIVIACVLLIGSTAFFAACTKTDTKIDTKTYKYHSMGTFNVYEGIAKSQMTFHGEVTDIQYRMSKDSLPHTFVTYKISTVIYGTTEGEDGKHITLRFLGGPFGDGSFLLPSLIPRFDIGNKDVLLVAGNGVSECPLVGCKAGRIRIYKDRVFTNAGQPIIGIDKGRVLSAGKMESALRVFSYPRPDFEKLYQRKEYREFLKKKGVNIDEDSLREMYEKNLPKQLSFRYVQHSGDGVDASKTGDPPINLPQREMAVVAKRQLQLTELLTVFSNNVIASEYRGTPASNLNPSQAFDSKLRRPTQ